MISRSLLITGLLSLGAAANASAKEHVISQKNKEFSKSELTIAPGDTVVFKNDDDTTHNVFSASESTKFNAGMQKPGVESKHTFEKPAQGEIRCAIHPKMKLKLTVKKD